MTALTRVGGWGWVGGGGGSCRGPPERWASARWQAARRGLSAHVSYNFQAEGLLVGNWPQFRRRARQPCRVRSSSRLPDHAACSCAAPCPPLLPPPTLSAPAPTGAPADCEEHMKWVYEKALARAAEFGIQVRPRRARGAAAALGWAGG